MERLYEIHSEGNFDLIVVDTPPTRNAIDFIEAPRADGRVLLVPAAAAADRAVPEPDGQHGVPALLPGRRPGARLAVPGGHRRVLHPVPDHVRRVRRAGPGGRAAAPRPAHHLRGREHARGGAGARGGVLHRGADGQAASTSAPWCSTRCCPTTCSTTRPTARAARLCDDAAELARLDGLAGVARRPTEAQLEPGARRGRRELPQLRGRGPAARRLSAASWRRRPDVVATRPGVRGRHPRPARSAPPRRADLDARGAGHGRRCDGDAGRTGPGAHRPGRPGRRPPAAPGRRRGACCRTCASPTCCSSCPPTGGVDALRGARPGAADDQPDPAPRGPRRAGHRRADERPLLARAWQLGSVVEGEVGHPEPQRARPAGLHPGALAGPAGGPDDPGVGPVGRPAARASSNGSTSRCSTAWPA